MTTTVVSKKFYSVTRFVNEFKSKFDLTGFKQLMIYFDIDEMFDCKTGAIAVKPLMIICGGGNNGNVKALRHKTILDLFDNNQPIITYKATKTKIRPNKSIANVWYMRVSIETKTFNEFVYYPMNVMMSKNERTINVMYQNVVNIRYKDDEEFEVDFQI